MKLQRINTHDPWRPMLVLFEYEPADVDKLCQACRDLAERHIAQFALHEQAWMHAVDGCQFVWRYSKRDIGVRAPPAGAPFVLEYSDEAWLEVEGKLFVMREPKPNHSNELTMEGDVNVIISPDGRW